MKIFRWKAIVPLLLLLAAMIAVWLLLLDRIIEKSIEFAGAQITGARVEIESVDVQVTAGRVVINGMQVADPNALMTNMVEVDELIADIRFAPLLQKKVIIDTLVVRGVRFGTPRTTSGELDRKSETTGAVAGRISQWTEDLPVPELSLRGLGNTVNVNAIESDSLQTVQLSNRIVSAADSMWERWQRDIRSLDLSAEIDSARAVARRLGNINLRRLSLTRIREITETLSSARNVVKAVEVKRDNLQNLRSGIRNGVRDLQDSIRLFDDMRDLDYRYASGLLQIPSIDAPDIGPALFAEMALDHLQPFLNALEKVDRYAPPGLKARQQAGPDRSRLAGTTVHFPRQKSYPAFLLEYGEISLSLGDESSMEDYIVRVEGLNSDPVIYGRPTSIFLDRSSGSAGDRRITATAILDHTSAIPVDSIHVSREGMGMGTVSMSSIGGILDLGIGRAELNLVRRGDEIDAVMNWRSGEVQWESTGDKSGIEAFVWRTISALQSVEIYVVMKSSPAGYNMKVISNVAGELSRGLQRQLGDEIRRAQDQVRSAINERIKSYTDQARARAESIENQIDERVEELQVQLEEARAALEERLKNITDRLPAGIIPPN